MVSGTHKKYSAPFSSEPKEKLKVQKNATPACPSNNSVPSFSSQGY